MVRIGTLVSFIALLGGTASAAQVFEREDLFAPVDRHVHGSSVVECPNGDLLACWFEGSGERTADDVLINGARMKKGAKAWSPMFLMADTPGFPDCNPVLFLDRDERLWMFWVPVLAHRWECCFLKYRTSTDYQGDGAPKWNWQDVIVFDPGEGFADAIAKGLEESGLGEGMWGEYAPPYAQMIATAAQDPYKRQTGWMTRLHPLVLPSGRILLPLYSDGFNLSLAAISDDNGAHWRASGPIVGRGPTQPAFVRKNDGSLVAYLRDSGDAPMRVQVSTSRDDGQTWSTSKDIDIPNPDSSLDVIRLQDGAWVMIGNDVDDGRHRLVAALSDDEGATWKWKRPIENMPPGPVEFSYPSLIQTRDGLLHVTYSTRVGHDNTIRHCAMNAEWIRGGGN